jgi:hypothetical protein
VSGTLFSASLTDLFIYHSITYINTSAFIVYLIPYAVRRMRKRWAGKAEVGGSVIQTFVHLL